jgi:glycosyltransferase involved in cell wall biosynthesis
MTRLASQVLMLSKPVAPPWDDSTKNAVRDQVALGERYTYRVLVPRGTRSPAPGAIAEPIYRSRGRYSPGLRQNLRVMVRGLRPGGADLFHYYFAPNRLSCAAGRIQRRAAGVPTVHTICSAPLSYALAARSLFADRVIVLSEHARRRLCDAGLSKERLRLIRPGVAALEPPAGDARRRIRAEAGVGDEPLILFPGDLEPSRGAETVVRSARLVAERHPEATIVLACRSKTKAGSSARRKLEREVSRAGLGRRIVFRERISRMPALVGASNLVILPAESLYAKMDAPLVLLEAMVQGIPIVISAVPPLDELLAGGGGIGVPPGEPQALARAISHLLDDPDSARELGEAGRRTALETFCAKRGAQEVESVYDELLKA